MAAPHPTLIAPDWRHLRVVLQPNVVVLLLLVPELADGGD